ncbi:aldose epimerase family protein [Salinicoccus sp. RF5]|uniref:aldose epimerase family protein n=1 Tax=Salinicoccus sp. RF5 TaxID=2748874 RepID=UPI001E64E48A|nr:aldose epimerase family protein [Salinicoccus sp. RF5]MCC4722338.1 galactose mutarotase [Salinicoccus sp. RF5]
MKVDIVSSFTEEEKELTTITISNKGKSVTLLNFGARITSWVVPDKDGTFEDIVLGHEAPHDYLTNPYYFGAAIGRVAGRIRDGKAQLEKQTLDLTKNDDGNHLHGGNYGFDRLFYTYDIIQNDNAVTIHFSSRLEHMSDGYPGNLDIKISYTYTIDDLLIIDYTLSTDQDTLVNPTNHMYINLNGNLKCDILNHRMNLGGKKFGTVDESVMPTSKNGIIESSNEILPLADIIKSDNPQFKQFNGLDHPFIIEDERLIVQTQNGRTLSVETEDPVVVIFTCNDFDFKDSSEKHFYQHCGLTLEAQLPPDDINSNPASKTILKAGKTFKKRTAYQFNIQ